MIPGLRHRQCQPYAACLTLLSSKVNVRKDGQVEAGKNNG
jgi:hypothetical protein